ncbi:tapasin-related protein-like isoform X2 [Colossoma macropomum]|uniref:tapasin-related protein-like isoform X2 n=1 Tax=Colossoma macropomum TaxID=42526 RepID=UPI001864EAA0|nr:tapasin-related protein-like isoform X2 [Colossoma macropomum]
MVTEMVHVLQCGMTSVKHFCELCSVWMLLSFLSAVKTESAVLSTTSAQTVLQGKTTTVNCDYNKAIEKVFFSVDLRREQLLCSYIYQHKSWRKRSCKDNIRFIWTPETEEISFELLNLQINDSGVYTCAVERVVPPPVQRLGVQTTFIDVIARPVVSASCLKGSDGAPTVLCTAEGFYPAALEQVWIRDGERITYPNSSLINREYLHSSAVRWNSSINTDGSYSLTSYLHLPPTPEQVMYHCWVNHSSFNQPISVNISSTECYETKEEQPTGSDFSGVSFIMAGISFGVLAGVLLVTAVTYPSLMND